MTTPKLKYVLSSVCNRLSQHGIPHALMGAMAMAFYGIPRYTADIDLLVEEVHQKTILSIMNDLGYECFQNAAGFAQFDSEGGILGRVDYMFVKTEDGRDILRRSVVVNEDMLGAVPVVQPTDYVVLKLMAIANNKERRVHDSSDLNTLFGAESAELINPAFSPLDEGRIQAFAHRFHVEDILASLWPLPKSKNGEDV